MSAPIWDEKRKIWRLRITRDYVTKNFSSSKAGAAGKREVLRRSREWLENGSHVASRMRLSDAWDKFLEDCAHRLGVNSEAYLLNEKLGRLYLLPALGPKKLTAVTKADLQNVLNKARPHQKNKATLSKKYLGSIRSVLTQFWKFCSDREYCDPMRGTLYVPAGAPTIGKDILQPDDIKKLFEPSDLWYHKAFLLMAVTGLRPGELCGLQWKDIRKDCIEIHRAINCRGEITGGKNKNARRIIPASPLILDILAQQKFMTASLRSEWVFCSEVGAAPSQSTLRNHYIKLKEERGIAGCMYSLRHSFVSYVKNVMPEYMIKDLVGHSASMNTYGVYSHRVDGEIAEAAKLIDLTFKNALDSK